MLIHAETQGAPTGVGTPVDLPPLSRRWRITRGIAITLLILLVLGLIWAKWQRPWLINDYRDGYHHGSLSQEDYRTNCQRSAERHYPDAFSPKGTLYLPWNPEVRAFVTGCEDASFGLPNAWWHLDSRLSRDSGQDSD